MDKNISKFMTQMVYIWIIVSRLGLPSEYDYLLAEYSPIIPQKSITTNVNTVKMSFENTKYFCCFKNNPWQEFLC